MTRDRARKSRVRAQMAASGEPLQRRRSQTRQTEAASEAARDVRFHHPGDLSTSTPGWSWHGHVHPGGDEPAVWMDGLDVPFAPDYGPVSSAMTHTPGDPLPVRNAAETAVGPATLVPAGTRPGHHSPVRRYPWHEAYPALRRLMAQAPARNAITSLEYRNPVTGGPARPPWAACSRACPPGPGPGRAGRPPARSSPWPAGPEH